MSIPVPKTLYYLTFPAGKPVWLVQYDGLDRGQHVFTTDRGDVVTIAPDMLRLYKLEQF